MGLYQTLKVTVGTAPNTQSYYFRGQLGVYTGDIATETGVSEAPSDEENRARIPIDELLQKGVVVRVIASVSPGPGLPRKDVKLLVRRDKVATALDGLIDKTIDGDEIKSARVPTKATFY